MVSYAFVTEWRVEAPIQDVWEAIHHSEKWPEWWPGIEHMVELEPGDERGVGSLRRYTWRSVLPYRLTFDSRTTRVEPPTILEGIAHGDLEGTGRFRLWTEGAITVVRYEWHVRTTKVWMNLLAPVTRPLFEWNHNLVMRWGGEGLARLLGARLLASDAHAVHGTPELH